MRETEFRCEKFNTEFKSLLRQGILALLNHRNF